MTTQRTLFGIGAALLIGISAVTFADNDEGEHQNRRGDNKHGKHTMTSLDPAYQKECGSCHLAFPPSMLSSASWQKIMNGLAKHFQIATATSNSVRAIGPTLCRNRR